MSPDTLHHKEKETADEAPSLSTEDYFRIVHLAAGGNPQAIVLLQKFHEDAQSLFAPLDEASTQADIEKQQFLTSLFSRADADGHIQCNDDDVKAFSNFGVRIRKLSRPNDGAPLPQNFTNEYFLHLPDNRKAVLHINKSGDFIYIEETSEEYNLDRSYWRNLRNMLRGEPVDEDFLKRVRTDVQKISTNAFLSRVTASSPPFNPHGDPEAAVEWLSESQESTPEIHLSSEDAQTFIDVLGPHNNACELLQRPAVPVLFTAQYNFILPDGNVYHFCGDADFQEFILWTEKSID